jgi:hypothetical protein
MNPGPATTKAQHATLKRDLCRIELRRHRLVVLMLEGLLDEVPLSREQALEVGAELAWRREQIMDLQRLTNLHRTSADQFRRRERLKQPHLIGAAA